MPGICAFGYPFWYPAEMNNPPKAASTSTLCHQGAMASWLFPPDIIPVLDDIGALPFARRQKPLETRVKGNY